MNAIRTKGFVVGYDKKGSEIVWTVRVKDDACRYNGEKFDVMTVRGGTLLSKSGVDVTFELLYKDNRRREIGAFNVEITLVIPETDRLQLESETINLSLAESKADIILRILYPSEPHGGWPGTRVTIHEWKICYPKDGSYRSCTADEVVALEKLIGKWSKFRLTVHKTLGLVSQEA